MTRKQTKLLAAFVIAAATLVVAVVILRTNPDDDAPGEPLKSPSASSRPRTIPNQIKTVLAQYAGSESCRECHQEAFNQWTGSHHALAERLLEPEADRAAFDPPHEIRHGTQTSVARAVGDRFELETIGFGGSRESYPLQRAFGVSPLYQFLVPAKRGRFQVTELAYDPARKDWFDVYGDEDRRPGEWGHWTGRGMTWNVQCAACHNTRLVKGYDPKTDSYATTMAEMGVGCEACHGPLREHVEWQRSNTANPGLDPSRYRLPAGSVLPMCGSCHSRRVELTGNFQPGDNYFDHFNLTIVDDTDLYYADGQVREENFEYASFHSSRMYSKGVRCINCHEPHSGKPRFEGNALCMQCHKEDTEHLKKIDPATHSHHKPGTPGSLCVDCHMPLTTYMERHPRRDHGFTIPDPLLTKTYGIPNACNRCHDDKTVDWTLAAVEKWYGSLMERAPRVRTRAISEARQGNEKAIEQVLDASLVEAHPYWRAVLGGLLRLWPDDKRTVERLVELTRDEHPLVRGTAASALDRAVTIDPESVEASLQPLLKDPVRMVRIAAAWSLRRTVDPGSRAGNDLWSSLQFNADQPAGQFQLGTYNFERGLPEAAVRFFERATLWDPNSAPLRDSYAICLSALGRARKASLELQDAVRLEPKNPFYLFRYGLSLSGVDDLDRAIEAFEHAVDIAPDFVRAWYNLALAWSKIGEHKKALESITKAEELDSLSPDHPYVRAIVLKNLGRIDEARRAVERSLEVDPKYEPATRFLDVLNSDDERP